VAHLDRRLAVGVSDPQRIQLRRTKGWRKPEGAVIVARPSRWGNWYAVRRFSDFTNARYNPSNELVVIQLDKRGHRTGTQWAGFADEAEARAFAVDLHRRAMTATRFDVDGLLNHEHYLGPLRGHDLACWCPLDQPCHADTLLELANR
jgi:hypothetical protein